MRIGQITPRFLIQKGWEGWRLKEDLSGLNCERARNIYKEGVFGMSGPSVLDRDALREHGGKINRCPLKLARI